MTGPTTDTDRYSRWHTPDAQAAGEILTVTLPFDVDLLALELGQGAYPLDYPVHLRVDARTAACWTPVFEGRTAPAALRAALASPTEPVVTLPLAPARTRTLRLVLAGGHATSAWSVASVAVIAR